MGSGALIGDTKIKGRAAVLLTPLRPAIDQGPHEGHVGPVLIRQGDSVAFEDDLIGQDVGKARHRQTDYPRLAIGQASAVNDNCGFVSHGMAVFR
jgi:hypothetical protein